MTTSWKLETYSPAKDWFDLEQLVECRSRIADKLVGFCSFSFEWILLIFLQAGRSRAVGISEFVGGSKATDVVKLSNESRVFGKVVE